MSETKAKYEANNFKSLVPEGGELVSSNIEDLLWNQEAEQLLTVFKNGARYIYFHVPEVTIGKLRNAIISQELSVGKTFNGLVKKGGFEYQRIDDVPVPVEEEKERLVRGVEVGMLWFDNDPKQKLHRKIRRAVAYYQDKYLVNKNHHLEVLISDDDFPEDVLPETDYEVLFDETPVTVVMDGVLNANYFLIGMRDV